MKPGLLSKKGPVETSVDAAGTSACATVGLLFFAIVSLHAQTYATKLPITDPAIHYSQGPFADAASHLDPSTLKHDDRLGYLPSLLEHLKINPDSQALVFSRTSFQASKIGPRNPRAIYFGDDAAVGFVRGSDVMEVAAVDPKQGVVFYTFDARKENLVRQDVCLKCHDGPATSGVPGIFIGSVYPDAAGNAHSGRAIITDHRTPFADRWGGWYVNAAHGEQRDRANAVAPDPAEPETLVKLARFDLPGYLSTVSDIVALMTFEHQTQMTNYITRAGWLARMGKIEDSDIDALVNYMVFADEVPLPEPVEGVSTFTKTFPQRGPRDRQGRSLRDFDLQTRLFRYPLSYVIYSPQFDALPGSVRDRIYHKLYDRLKGRREILEILRDTKTGLPSWWPGI